MGTVIAGLSELAALLATRSKPGFLRRSTRYGPKSRCEARNWRFLWQFICCGRRPQCPTPAKPTDFPSEFQVKKSEHSSTPFDRYLAGGLLILFLSCLPSAGYSQSGGRVYKPIDFLWGEGENGNNWNSFGAYQSWWNTRAEGWFAACMAIPRTYGSSWQCSKTTITGSDPYTGTSGLEIYYNGQAYWNWLRIEDYTTYTSAQGINPPQIIVTTRQNGSSGDFAVFANPICPALMNDTRVLTSSQTDPAKYYSVTCVDSREAACRTCTTGSLNNVGAPPLLGNPIDPLTLEKVQSAADYVIESGRIAVRRNYRSGQRQWSNPVQQLMDFTPQRPTSFPVVTKTFILSGNGVTFLPFSYELVRSTLGSEIHVQRPDGSRMVLTEGIQDTFSSPDKSGLLNRRLISGGWEWDFKTPDNKLETYRQSDGNLIKVTYPDGHSIDYEYAVPGAVRVTSRLSGRALVLNIGADRMLQQVLLPDGGSIGYVGTSGVYSGVTYADGQSVNYIYDELANIAGSNIRFAGTMTGMLDELGIRIGTYKYDNSGFAISTERAGSVDRFSTAYTGGGYAPVTDPMGVVHYLYWYTAPDGSKRLQTATQVAGSGSAGGSKVFAYDAAGNISSADDFKGARVCYSSDPNRNLGVTVVQGLSNSVACSTVVPANAALPAGARKISTLWHPDWRLETKVAEPGRITTNVYQGQPDPFSGNALASCAPATALLPDGKRIAVLCKRVEQATTDSDGRLGFTAALQSGVVNRVSTWTYNQYGQVLTAKSPRTDVNATTTYAYYADTAFTGTDPNAVGHTIGDLQTVTNAVGKVTTYTSYNKHGQVLEMSDPNGVLTTNTYDLRQRLLSTSVGGQTTSYTYDAAGQLLKVTAPDLSWVGYEYDPAHRLTAAKDNLGNRVEYTLDNAGNKTAEQVKDPGGALRRQLSRGIDALGRVQQTVGRQ